MVRRVALLLLICTAWGLVSVPATAGWRPDRAKAVDYATTREGSISFAVVGPGGRLYGYRRNRVVPAASVVKVMLMVTYLRHPDVRGRDLNEEDKDLLAPMIRRSDNDAATRIADYVGERRIERLARSADMKRFRWTRPWGLTRVTAAEQARFMFRLERYIPNRHERYARELLATIVRSQRWGFGEVDWEGWKLFFKGGWGTGTGRVTHQIAFLEKGDRRIALAVMTEFSPDHDYGTRTLRGIAKRLLRTMP